MTANNILTANFLDIIFEGKNKAYGAYELRKTYNKRVSISLIITIGTISILLIGSAIANSYSPKNLKSITGPDIIIQPPPPVEPPPPTPPPVLPPPPVATIAFPPPVIVIDELVLKPPPEVEELLHATIDIKTTDGIKDIDNIAPPLDVQGTQVVAKPDKTKNEDTVCFLPVEINASFPGGAGAWTKYVSKEIQRNTDEFTENDYGKCIVKFIVDKTGKVSHVEATTMKGTKLAEIATNAIRKGPDWIPAQQNGRYVNAYRLQPVTLNSHE